MRALSIHPPPTSPSSPTPKRIRRQTGGKPLHSVLLPRLPSHRRGGDHVSAGDAEGTRILVGAGEQLSEVGSDVLPPAGRLQQLARLAPATVTAPLHIDDRL